MLTEGWDCSTVTHIIGLRPFMSQLLCEQVVGRGLRRASYEPGRGRQALSEEVAKVFGVPFEVDPVQGERRGRGRAQVVEAATTSTRCRTKAQLEIRFPRVEGYTPGDPEPRDGRLGIGAAAVAGPGRIPPEVEVKALHCRTTTGGPPSRARARWRT